MKELYSLPIKEVFKNFNSSEHGLSGSEAKNRLKQLGPNKLPEAKVDGLLLIFLRQFKSPIIYLLFIAAIVVFLIGEEVDSIVIGIVLLFNSIIGTIQEGRAQNTLLALKKLVETNTTVLRDGKELIIPHGELVPGDIIILQEGEKVPADARLISCQSLRIDEAILTGESVPKNKIVEPISGSKIAIAEQKNMVFRGTNILTGNGKAIVVTTGTKTFIGKISEKITAIDSEIPLKKNIRYLSNVIIIVVAIISALLLALGLLQGESLLNMIFTVISLAVSIIPEGLPIVITLVLATGVWRMSKRNALVKKLQAVEALGQAKIIAVDKTGTITKNELIVQKLYTAGSYFSVSGQGYEPKGEFRRNGELVEPLNHPELIMAGKIALLTSNARVAFNEEEKIHKISGDPTEAAMLTLGEKVGFRKNDLEEEQPRILEIPFDYKTKYHLVMNKNGKKDLMSVVGAPEVVLDFCKKIWYPEKTVPLTREKKEELDKIFAVMSKKGYRAIAYAIKEKTKIAASEIDSLTFVGFYFMRDIIREEVFEAMQKTKEAGIKVVMITGDHRITAKAIAREVGIFHDGDEILTGEEIDKLSEKQLTHKLGKVSVFARVTPEHKLKIIEGYKKRGEIIAMTGDGVNDALSLVAADLGVSMGKIGTEVAKEASDIILLDDNFGSIVAAVEEGRSIYKTIKKVLLYLFSTSVGEVLVITGAIILGLPLPILAVQILWLNLVTDGFLDLSLAMEPKEGGLLKNYKQPGKYFVDKLMAKRMVLMGIPMMVGTLYLFSQYHDTDLKKGWTIALTTLAVFQWFNAWNCRHESKSVFAMNPLKNKYLIAATAIVIILQLLAVYTPLMQKMLHTTPLNLSEWILITIIASSVLFVEEARKLFSRIKNKVPQLVTSKA